MKLSPYELNQLELEALATAPTTTLGQVIRRVIDIEQTRMRERYRKSGKLGTEDMTKDIRWKMGACEEGLNFVLKLIEEAGIELNKKRTQEDSQ